MSDPKQVSAGSNQEASSAEAPTIDFDSSDSPIYLQLTTIFRRQITSGAWPVDGRIPTIETLAGQYGVANGTVRQALAFIEREGLIRRIRRRGTMVIKQPYQPQPVLLPQTGKGMARLLEDFTIAAAEEREATIGEKVVRSVARAYSRDGEVVILEQERGVTGSGAVPGIARLVQLQDEGCTVEQTTTIGTADVEAAKKLTIPVNAPVVLVRHVVKDTAGQVIFESDWLMRGDLFTLIEHYPGPKRVRP